VGKKYRAWCKNKKEVINMGGRVEGKGWGSWKEICVKPRNFLNPLQN